MSVVVVVVFKFGVGGGVGGNQTTSYYRYCFRMYTVFQGIHPVNLDRISTLSSLSQAQGGTRLYQRGR